MSRRPGQCARTLAIALLAAIACGACSSVPTGGTGFVFSPAIEAGIEVPHVLWLERVEIPETSAGDHALIETAFTYNLARLLRQKKIFKAVRIYGGAAAPDDWVARVRIERASQKGKIPPVAYLGSALTLGIYTGVGRIQDLEFEMAGSCEMRDGSGRPLGTGQATHQASLAVYRKNMTNAFSFFMDERSRFVDDLLRETLAATGVDEL